MAMDGKQRIRAAVRALCDLEHDDPCGYPDCECAVWIKNEYIRHGKAVLNAVEQAEAVAQQPAT